MLDVSNFGPLDLVILQTTSFCNLDCDYCYLPDRHLKNQFSLDLIEPVFRRIFESPFVGDRRWGALSLYGVIVPISSYCLTCYSDSK